MRDGREKEQSEENKSFEKDRGEGKNKGKRQEERVEKGRGKRRTGNRVDRCLGQEP